MFVGKLLKLLVILVLLAWFCLWVVKDAIHLNQSEQQCISTRICGGEQ